MKIAGAPITWGVCEVPGWGHQMDPQRVLTEMRAIGLDATELGPEGFLPTDPGALRELLDRHGLTLVGGFVPVVLHVAETWEDERERLLRQVDLLASAGGQVAVLAAISDQEGYDATIELSPEEWHRLAQALDEAAELVGERGLQAALHPHYGTVVETPPHVERVLESTDVALCLDTGHLMVGGGDPVSLARQVPERIAHAHMKDVRADMAARVRAGELSYYQAVVDGMYRPLGEGDVDIDAIVAALQSNGFSGWYVLEQDTVLDSSPPPGGGPVAAAQTSRQALLERSI